MVHSRGRRIRRSSLVAASGLAVVLGTLGGSTGAHAFDHNWALTAGAGCALLDDAPGAGVGNDAAFGHVRNSLAGDESCTWQAAVPNISSTSFPQLRVRMAVNDSSRVTVRVITTLNVVIGTATQTGNNQFVTVVANLAGGHLIARVTLTIDDNPNNAVASGRSSALLDEIRVQRTGGATGWVETFTRAG